MIRTCDWYYLHQQETELSRAKQQIANFNEMRETIAKKLQEQKESKSKQLESFQSILSRVLTYTDTVQRYTTTLEKSWTVAFDNLLLLVDWKIEGFDSILKEMKKLEFDGKDRKLMDTKSKSLIDKINEQISSDIKLEELQKIFNKVVTELRGRKYLDYKESTIINGPNHPQLQVPSSPLHHQQTTNEERRPMTLLVDPVKVQFQSQIFEAANEQPTAPGTLQEVFDKLLTNLTESNQSIQTFKKMAEQTTENLNLLRMGSLVSRLKSNLLEEKRLIEFFQSKQIGGLLAEENQDGSNLRESLQDLQENLHMIEYKFINIARISNDKLSPADGRIAEYYRMTKQDRVVGEGVQRREETCLDRKRHPVD
jgi:hypothetical protein